MHIVTRPPKYEYDVSMRPWSRTLTSVGFSACCCCSLHRHGSHNDMQPS